MRNVSSVTGIAGGRVAILVTVDVFRLLDGVRNSKMSTVTGIAEGRLAMGRQGVTRKALLLAKSCKDLLAQTLPKKNERGGWGGERSPPNCKTFNKKRTCRFLLSFARFCGNMSFPAQRC